MENLQDACLCVQRPLVSKGGTFYEIRINIDHVTAVSSLMDCYLYDISYYTLM